MDKIHPISREISPRMDRTIGWTDLPGEKETAHPSGSAGGFSRGDVPRSFEQRQWQYAEREEERVGRHAKVAEPENP